MTFIPLASAKVRPVAEGLRTGLGGTARLALDLVEPERPEFIRAFQFAFGCEGWQRRKGRRGLHGLRAA